MAKGQGLGSYVVEWRSEPARRRRMGYALAVVANVWRSWWRQDKGHCRGRCWKLLWETACRVWEGEAGYLANLVCFAHLRSEDRIHELSKKCAIAIQVLLTVKSGHPDGPPFVLVVTVRLNLPARRQSV